MKKRIVSGLTLWLLFVMFPVAGFTQAVYGTISGTVTDPSGAAVAKAKVTITDTGKGVTYTTTTNDSGNYTQSHLIVGAYDVRVEMPGFTAFVQKSAEVPVD